MYCHSAFSIALTSSSRNLMVRFALKKAGAHAGNGQYSFSQGWEDKGHFAEGALFVGLSVAAFTAAQFG